jgi:hypothetical protein
MAMSLTVLLWPIIAKYWQWLFCRRIGINGWNNYYAYIISSTLVGALAVLGYAVS